MSEWVMDTGFSTMEPEAEKAAVNARFSTSEFELMNAVVVDAGCSNKEAERMMLVGGRRRLLNSGSCLRLTLNSES